MYQPAVTTTEKVQATSIEVWSPKAISWLTFFFGLPTGLILAVANWRQLEQHDKARTHIIGAVIAFIVYIAAVALIPGSLGTGVVLIINLGGLLYLRSQAQEDIDNAAVRDVWANFRNAWVGVGIGIGVTIVLAVLVGILATIVGGAA